MHFKLELAHPQAGFENDQDQVDRSIRAIARELFTDLNKNAKTVDRARELILDDRSVNARCVRTLLTDKTAEDSDTEIPLSLVRWQDDSNRFDSSYYINSLVHLDLLVKSLLNLKEPNDPLDENQVKNFIKDINNSLGINGQEVKYKNQGLLEFYEKHYYDEDEEETYPQVPFTRLPEQYMSAAVDGFIYNFKPWVLRLLLGLKPYKAVLEYARDNDLIEGVFGKYHAQTSKHRRTIREGETAQDSEWLEREILRHQRNIAEIKENQWAFKAIFQKAIVRLGKIVEFENKGQDKSLGNITDVIRFLDNLYDDGVLNVYAPLEGHSYKLWTFIALNPGNEKIKVAKAVEDRIFFILCLWYFGSRKLQEDIANKETVLSPRKLRNFFSAAKSTVRWPNCDNAHKKIYTAFNTAPLFGKDADELGDDEKKSMVFNRFAAVLEAGIPEYKIVKTKGLLKDLEGSYEVER